MDDATFELLKKIDEGFEEGSGPYGERDFLSQEEGRSAALIYLGNEGFDLRMAVMKAVEAEKARRAEAEKPSRKRSRTGPKAEPKSAQIVDLMGALKASIAAQGKKPA